MFFASLRICKSCNVTSGVTYRLVVFAKYRTVLSHARFELDSFVLVVSTFSSQPNPLVVHGLSLYS